MARPPSNPADAVVTPRKTVLVLDDDSMFLDMVLSVLERSEITAVGVTKVAEAFDWLDSHAAAGDPLAILMDIVMPDADGIDFIRGLIPRRCRSPLIAMTSGTGLYLVFARNIALGHGLNFVGSLPKPLDFERLVGQIRDCEKERAF